MRETIIIKIYERLLKEYGPQGWWPLLVLHGTKTGTNPTKTGSINGYHVSDYEYPKTDDQIWEIVMGALLTQNTSWPQVEKALINLKDQGLFSPHEIINGELDRIKESIKPAGYFNQKGDRLVLLAKWFVELKDRIPTRKELLNLKGVGPETADSILLYAFKQKQFVVDAYTKRIFVNLGIVGEKDKENYDKIKEVFEKELSEAGERYDSFEVFQEYHALIVEHAKRFYSKKDMYSEDFLLNIVK